MPDPKQPRRPKTTKEILDEMESVSKGGSLRPEESRGASSEARGEGALKSLLGFFVKVVPEEEQQPGAGKPSAAHAASSPAPRTGPKVADLVAGETKPQFTPPPSSASADIGSKPFEQIYQEARLPECPCTVDELAKLLDNPTVANQPLSVKVVAVNLTLSARGVGADVPIADAVRRDRALDSYQQMLDQRAAEADQRNAVKIQQITLETEEYLKRKQAEIEALRAETAEAKSQSVDFSVRREAEEKRLANLISPFLEGAPNPVTVGNKPGEPSSQ
jgi:hypothetical protein